MIYKKLFQVFSCVAKHLMFLRCLMFVYLKGIFAADPEWHGG